MKKFLPYLIIALLCIIAYWQVAFLVHTLKYDILDGYLPGHYFVSECLRNNVFPLWNPYQQLGTPIYADLLNTNYLVDLLIGRLFPYTNITFHILFIIYLIIAGSGVYKLSRQLMISNQFSLLIGIMYPLSGFFTGNAQHIQFIISAAWLPLSLLYFIRLSADVNIRNMMLFVIFTTLLSTGGYPSIAIMQTYILGILYVYYLILFVRRNKHHLAFSFTFYCIAAAGLLLALNLGILTGLWQSTPHVSRFLKITYDFSITNSFPPISLISLISPLVPAIHPALFGTDISMNNHYFSVILLIFFIYALFSRNNRIGLGILAAGFLMLLISFGAHFFIHRILFEYVPLFNKFRHPSAFRIFTILFFLIYTGVQVTRNDPARDENFRLFRKIYVIFLFTLLLICLASLGFMVHDMLGPTDFRPAISSLLNDYGIFGPLFLQSAIILLINSIFVFCILIRKKNHLFYRIVTLMLVAEALIFTQLNQYFTVIYKHNPLEIREFLKNSPSGFPLPDHHLISENTDQSVANVPLIHNTNTYAKTGSPDVSKYPFSLNGFRSLRDDSLLFDNSVNHEWLYFGDSILPMMQRNTVKRGAIEGDKSYVFVEDAAYQEDIKDLKQGWEPGDTIVYNYFSPSRMSFTTSSVSTRLAVLLQNDYPGWKVYIDGTETKHYMVNRSLIGTVLPAGNHELTYEYTNPLYKNATLFSFSLFFFLLLVVFTLQLVKSKKNPREILLAGAGIAILVVIPVVLALWPVTPFAEIQEKNNLKIADSLDKIMENEQDSDVFMLFNTESPDPFKAKFHGKNVSYQRFRFAKDGIALWDRLDTLRTNKLVYVWSNVLEIPELRDIIQLHYPEISTHSAGERFTVTAFSKESDEHQDCQVYTVNDYEGIPNGWSFNQETSDSVTVYSGSHSEKLGSLQMFSTTFRYTLDDIPADGIRVFTALRFLQKGDQSSHLVITVSRKGKNVHYHAVDLSPFRSDKAGWNKAFTSQQWLKSSLHKGDEIIVYCWNSGNNEAIYVDDFIVKLEGIKISN